MPALDGQPGVSLDERRPDAGFLVPPRPVPLPAAFAALAGVSPLEASSGKITRHRLNPFGDRQLVVPAGSQFPCQ